MIKRKSKFGPDVFFAPWECVLNGKHPLFFIGMMEIFDIRFFLGGKEAIYVVTIPRRSPFRLVDETHLQTYSILKEADDEPPLARNEVYDRKVWKAWGTPFLKDLGPFIFLDYEEEKRFQYIILTEDESPEFVCYEPKIDVYPKGHETEIIKRLFDEDMKRRKDVGFDG